MPIQLRVDLSSQHDCVLSSLDWILLVCNNVSFKTSLGKDSEMCPMVSKARSVLKKVEGP